jgi:uncharacterized protein YjbI with pentapeptide repeats
MFVAINNKELSTVLLDTEMKRRREAMKSFTNEIAMWALSKTNHYANIKVIIKNIKKRPVDEWIGFKEFVLSCVDGREQPDSVVKDLKELAKLGGYEEEFNQANKLDKIYRKDVCKAVDVDCINDLKDALANKCFVGRANIICDKYSTAYLDDLDMSNVHSFDFFGGDKCSLERTILPSHVSIQCRKVSFDNANFKNVKSFKLDNPQQIHSTCGVDFYQAKNLSPIVDFSNMDEIDLCGCDLSQFKDFSEFRFKAGADIDMAYSCNFPKVVDARGLDIDLSACDFSGVEKFLFTKIARLDSSKNFPKKLEFVDLETVRMRGADFAGVDEVKYVNCQKVGLSESQHLPKVLDFSQCENVYMVHTDLSGVEIFKGCRKLLNMEKSKNLPKVLDVSNCDEVNFTGADLTGVEKIKFKKGARVSFWEAKGLPKKLDVSMCEYVSFFCCDMTGVEEVKFFDEKHKEYCMDRAENFSGKIKYDNVSKIKRDISKGIINAMSSIYEVE